MKGELPWDDRSQAEFVVWLIAAESENSLNKSRHQKESAQLLNLTLGDKSYEHLCAPTLSAASESILDRRTALDARSGQ